MNCNLTCITLLALIFSSSNATEAALPPSTARAKDGKQGTRSSPSGEDGAHGERGGSEVNGQGGGH